MSYQEQIEAQIAAYPQTASAYVPSYTGVTTLPDTHVAVHVWDETYCELRDGNDQICARFNLVG
jgi:hypothetical protein